MEFGKRKAENGLFHAALSRSSHPSLDDPPSSASLLVISLFRPLANPVPVNRFSTSLIAVDFSST